MSIDNKLTKLNDILEGFGKCAIAFSGGVDSTFLLAAAIRVLGKENVTAITVVPPYVAGWEIEEAGELAVDMDVSHIKIKSEMIDEVKTNPTDRCYICKTALFKNMRKKAFSLGTDYLCDGSNADDTGDYRPGMRALKELGIHSPLLEADLSKQDIRDLSKRWNVSTWDKPPYACLLTRVPHNTEIDLSLLDRIEQSEVVMIKAGFPYVRVRHHGDTARIEIPRDRFEEFISGTHYIQVTEKLKELGYHFVTLDLGGYKMGNMNQKGTDNG
jgi:pyridinium-3,5-biscarboxylic acid mononucleotide sulfurtransferase